MLVDGFEHPVGDRNYIRGGGQITEGRPGGLTFPDNNGTAPNDEPYGFVDDDPTTDGWYSATDHGEYNPGFRGYHLGEDWNSSTGDDLGEPIYAVANGTIVRMGDDGVGLYGQAFGNYIVIRHDMPEGPPVYSFYAHLDDISSDIYTTDRGDIIGATVTRGQQIGTMGTTGASDFPHLHFEMYRGVISTTEKILDERGYSSTARPNGWVDPTDFINANRVVGGTDDEADLTAEITSVSNFAPGQTAIVNINIENVGSGDATSALTEIALWNADTDTLLATTLQVQHGAVSGNSSIPESFDFSVPAGLAPGTYYFRVEVGRLGNEPDENTSNNFTDFFEVFVGGTGGPGPADLFIQNLALDNGATVTVGSSLGMDIFVGNRGNTDAPNSTVAFYLSTDDTFDTTDVLVDEKDISGIASGDVDSTANTVDLSSFSAGTYWLFAVADIDADVDEGPGEGDNTSSRYEVTITDPSTTVDLQATLLSAPNSVVELGTTFTAVFEYENSGSTLVDEVGYLAYVLDSDGNEVERRKHGTRFNFDPDETAERSVNVQVDSTYVPGNYALVFEIDDENEFAESNEGNNVATFSFEVVEATPEAIDLTPSNLSLSTTSVIAGDAINISWQVENLGTDTAINPYTGIYISTDAEITTSDTLLVEQGLFSTFGPGEVDTEIESGVVIPDTLPAGTYYVGAIADNRGTVSETDEENNVSNIIQIEVLSSQEDIDLAIGGWNSGGTRFEHMSPGDTESVFLTLVNYGADTSPAGEHISIILSSDRSVSDEDIVLTSVAYGALDGGGGLETVTGIPFTIPTEITPGTYNIGYVVDIEGVIQETDETNNVIWLDHSTEIIEPGPADLDVWSTGWNVSELISGQMPDFGITIKNNGETDAGSFTVRFYLSQDSVVGDGDIQIGEQTISGLAVDEETQRITANMAVPYSVIAGDYFFLAVVDPDDDIPEDDEANNIFYMGGDIWDPIEVSPAQDVHSVGTNGDDMLFGGGADLIEGVAGGDTVFLSGDSYHTSGYVAFNVSSDTQVGTQAQISLEGLLRIKAVTDGGAGADRVQLTDEADAFFLHDAYSGFHSSVALAEDYVGNESAARFANIEEIHGGDGDDIIDLTSPDYSLAGVAMSIDGGEGNDVIWGSDANENISGGNGNDTIFGGIGTDLITGGAGADVFDFTRTSTNTSVTDFDVIEGDTLRFYNAGGAVFDASSVALTTTGIQISYTDTASSIDHGLSISLAQSASDFTATLAEIQNALEII